MFAKKPAPQDGLSIGHLTFVKSATLFFAVAWSRNQQETLMKVTVTGIAWYRREDYARLKAMFQDGENLPDTFGGWLETAQRVYDTLTAEGIRVVKANIDPETFPGWCRARGHAMNTPARMAYAQEFAAKTPVPS